MKKRILLYGLAALGAMALIGVAWADEGGTVVNGTSSVGAHLTTSTDVFGKVGEFYSDANLEKFQADAAFSLTGATDQSLFDLHGRYFDKDTKSFGFTADAAGPVKVRFDYQSFLHNLDHDNLENLQASEANADGSIAGKKVFHHDLDPLGRYSLQYEKMTGGVEYDLASIREGKAYVTYTDQRRHGWKQTLAIDHCAFCHVEGNRREIDEQTRTWKAGIKGKLGRVAFGYEFQAQDYLDHADSPSRHWSYATHPGAGDNFAGAPDLRARLQFHDVTLPYQVGPNTEKRTHEFTAKVDVNARNTVRGAYSHARVENSNNNLSSDFDGFAFGWLARLGKSSRLTARVLRYAVDVDDAYVDLNPYRDGRGGGGQDFDWTRVSAANRDVWQADMVFRTKLAKRTHLNVDWRHKVVDRDAMNQTQTNYYPDPDTGTNIADPSHPIANESTTDRFRATFFQRFNRKGNMRLTYAYTHVDKPFMNLTGICEPSLRGEDHTLIGNPATWYFQRERVGNATSLPDEVHQVNWRSSYQVNPRLSLNAFVNAQWESNDSMNSYSLDRDIVTPGVNIWTAPNDRLMLTMGYAYNRVKSNAKFCPPLFGG